jgi:hypothetical protein
MTNLTLEERDKFEALLTEYANASIALVQASGRRHDALHAIEDYVNNRTGRMATDAYHEGIASVIVPADVPTGTSRVVFNNANGASHLSVDPSVPHDDCLCAVCNDARAAQRITKRERRPPISDTSGGN